MNQIIAALDELERMPRLGLRSRLSNDALRGIFEGKEIHISSLKVRIEDIAEDRVTLAFALCDAEDHVIVNIGRHTMRRVDTLTLITLQSLLKFDLIV